jgi:predicted aminopeptidase
MRPAFLLLVLGALSGCASVHYLQQAATGEAALLANAQPIEQVVAAPDTPPDLADKLRLAQRIRAFAVSDLKLPDNGSYTRYVDVGRPYALWNVVSTPALSLRPVESCFPIAGCLGYRGYYSKDEAEHYAAERKAAGDDVFLYGVPAYSTIGWFSDPLLSTTLHYGEMAMARLIFHELAHQRVYVKDDSSFNEAFATAVEEEGLQRWLAHEHRPDLMAHYAVSQARQLAFMQMMMATRHELAKLYASDQSDAEKRRQKPVIQAAAQARYGALKAQWGGEGGYDLWFDPVPNNAHFASLATYQDKVPGFRALLHAHGDDFDAFYDAVNTLGRSPRAKRNAILMAMAVRSGEVDKPSAAMLLTH